MQKGENISVAVALEIPSLAPNESKLSLAGSLGIIKKVLLTIFMVVFYFALCQSASAVPYDNTIGNKTISGTTFVVDGNQWIKEGNLTIGSGAILQINPGSSFQFELTHQINMSGGQIFQSDSDGIIKKGEVNCTCVSGACCDGCSFRPSTYACRVATGACDIAETCTGSSDICPADLYVTNNTQVTGCNGTCQACQSGACGSATVGTDPGSLCPINVQSAQGGDPNYCQQRTTDGLCNGAGACNGYGSWSNINEGLVCASTGYCSGSTYYSGNTCSAGTCAGVAAGCCTGSYCSAGNYCRQSDHSCQPVPVCQVRNETGFGTTNVTNNTQATGCNGTCQACQSGSCGVATAGTDPGGLCPINTQYAQGGDPYYCQKRTTDGNCNSTGACNGYGGWSNINAGLVCASTGYCSGSTYYSGNTCSAGTCAGVAAGCCTGSYCSAGNYCRQSDHSCQPVPVCQVRNETGFGTTNVTNNTQATGCDSFPCQACQNGVCDVATAGTDPAERCSGYTCTDKLRGWSGTSCVLFSGPTANNGMCGSGGSCASVADSCTGYGAQSGSAYCGSEGCKKSCPFGVTATSYDTVAEVCYIDSAQHSCSAGYACDSTGTCKAVNGQTCSLGSECLSGFCVNGYCCNSACGGNCDRCNVAGSLGTCTNVDADCTGNCDVCSAGNCAASNALCSNTPASCYCSGSGTSFNCQTCPDTYGNCGAPTCSSYTCGNDTASYNNTQPSGCNSACHYCSGGTCTYLSSGSGYGCTAAATTCSGADTCNSSGNCLTNDVANNTQVTNCTGTCRACQNGVCNYATSGTDPGTQCPYSTQYQQGGDTYWCQQSIKDGNCNSSGACNDYGNWSNINQGQKCASATSWTCSANKCKSSRLTASYCSSGTCPAQATEATYATSAGAYPNGQICVNGSFTTATCGVGYYCFRGAPYTCLDKYHRREQAYGCAIGADTCGPGIGECGYGSDCDGTEISSCKSGGICGGSCTGGVDDDGDGYTDGQDTDCGGCGQCTSGECCNTSTGCYKSGACTDDGNPCTSDICSAGTCTHPAGNAGTVCRISIGACDLAETCNGASTSCPADITYAANTVECRAAGANATCDPAEKCTGSSNACPTNVYAANTTDCGTCVKCNGSGSCNYYYTSGTQDSAAPGTCNAAAATCSGADTCGTSGACNANDLTGQQTNCNTACHYCSGGTCTYLTSGSGYGCTAAATACSNADTCNASGNCLPNDKAAGQYTGCNAICQYCNGSGTCTSAPAGATGYGCTDDGYTCTDDVCQSWGCTHPAKAGQCKIAGVCYTNGQYNPANKCQKCDHNDSVVNSEWLWTNVAVNTDPGGQCAESYACSAGLCAETYTSGLCDGNGACKAGVTTNCLSGYACSTSYGRCYNWLRLYCDSTNNCSGNTWYEGYKCDGYNKCTVPSYEIGCCQGSKCSAGYYCEQANHTCTALPACKVRNESGFGYTNAANFIFCSGGLGICRSGVCDTNMYTNDPDCGGVTNNRSLCYSNPGSAGDCSWCWADDGCDCDLSVTCSASCTACVSKTCNDKTACGSMFDGCYTTINCPCTWHQCPDCCPNCPVGCCRSISNCGPSGCYACPTVTCPYWGQSCTTPWDIYYCGGQSFNSYGYYCSHDQYICY